MKCIRSIPLVFAGMFSFAGTASAATIYNALADFSTTQNPNGVWTFGRSTAASGGTFNTYDNYVVDTVYSIWRDNDHLSEGAPSVWMRTDLNTLNFHPGPGGGLDPFSIIRFTAPSAGSYKYTVAFGSIDFGSKNVHIIHNLNSLFTSTIGGVETTSDSNVLNLAMGDTVDVVVDPNGPYNNDATQVGIEFEVVPEPASALLLGMSTLALTTRRRRSQG